MAIKRGHTAKSLIVAIGASSTLLVVLLLFPLFMNPTLRQDDQEQKAVPALGDTEWKALLTADKVRVSAIVFYGRRQYVRILDKYIKKNLLSVGGLLEEVMAHLCPGLLQNSSECSIQKQAINMINYCTPSVNTMQLHQVLWIVRTEDADDLRWLEQTLLPSEPTHYKRLESSGIAAVYYLLDAWNHRSQTHYYEWVLANQKLSTYMPLHVYFTISCVSCVHFLVLSSGVAAAGEGFANHYKQLVSDRYYIKLDDDIMFIKDGAMEAMLHEKLRNRFWIVSANIINHSGKV